MTCDLMSCDDDDDCVNPIHSNDSPSHEDEDDDDDCGSHLQQNLLLQVLVGSVQQLFGSQDSVPHHVLSPTPDHHTQSTHFRFPCRQRLILVDLSS